jgi:hypothetical protein
MRKQLFSSFSIFFLLILATILVILYGKGYRIGNIFNGKPTISKTGLLVATSTPDGAQLFINGNLTSATDDTIDLLPGEYTIRLAKEGYFPWEKKVKIQKEVVTKADALLFPTAPRLENITSSGVEHPVLDPSGKKLAFRIASQSAKKNGIYVLDMNTTPILTLRSSARQITDDVTDQFSKATYEWSPDGEEILATIMNEETGIPTYYNLRAGNFNDTPRNVTAIVSSVLEDWDAQRTEKAAARVNGLSKKLKQLIKEKFTILAWSPDDTKILYTASASAEIPFIITPRHIGLDSMREVRTIEKDGVYVYDLKDDYNTKVLDANDTGCKEAIQPCTPPVQWFPDSDHLIVVTDNKIRAVEDDGTNSTTIYAGPFVNNYVFSWPNGSKLVILTNFNNTGTPANLYTISLK